MKKIVLVFIISCLASSSYARGLAMSSGILDYSDGEKRSGFVEATYTFKNADDENFFGKFTPITGAMITQENAVMVYSGFQGNFSIGNFIISPSFSPGYYESGKGKDLGSYLEFKTQINLGWNFGNSSNAGLSYSHISNADVGIRNPGANNIAFTFFKQY
ncbi:MAG: acyloxyacyl hydrolase [alpha proteobacterium HIMB114]|nr:MAG: acyloxyacyl hydrolase [alpha proteobacterium HIMB114]